MRTTIVVRFVYDASAASSDASGRGPDKVNAAHPPFDSTSYTRRTKIVVRGAFPIAELLPHSAFIRFARPSRSSI
jgi:hypothetical protein